MLGGFYKFNGREKASKRPEEGIVSQFPTQQNLKGSALRKNSGAKRITIHYNREFSGGIQKAACKDFARQIVLRFRQAIFFR